MADILKPQVTQKILKTIHLYLYFENKMEQFFSYTRYFCVHSCHKRPVGCCDYDWYNYGIPNNRIGMVFKILRGAVFEKTNSDNICKYFRSKNGCHLKHFRSPFCIGMICPTLCEYIKSKLGVIYNSNNFIDFFSSILMEKISIKRLTRIMKEINCMLSVIEKGKLPIF